MSSLNLLSFPRPLFFLDSDGGGGGGGGEPAPQNDADKSLSDFEKWLETQPEDARKQYEAQLGRLRDTVSKLREANKAHEKDAALLKQLREAEEKRQKDAMTEVEKAKADAAEALKQKEEAENKAKEYFAQLQAERLSYAVIRIASELKFADPNDAERLADFDPKTYIVNDSPDEKAIRKTLEELAKNKPYLLIADKQKGHGTPPTKREGERKSGEDANGFRVPLVRL